MCASGYPDADYSGTRVGADSVVDDVAGATMARAINLRG